MIVKVSVPNRFQFKAVSSFTTMLWQKKGEVHYIGGADILPPPLESKREAEMISRLGTEGEKEARALLIEHNLRLVAHMIKKYYANSKDQDELISIGTVGLIKAVNTFDASKGSKFATYAGRCIENEILMHFRGQKKTANDVYIDEPIDTDKDGNTLTLMDIVADSSDVFEQVDLTIRSKQLYRYLDKCLEPRELDIITRRYGLYNHMPQTQREVADRLGISRSYVSRIEKRALSKLKAMYDAGA